MYLLYRLDKIKNPGVVKEEQRLLAGEPVSAEAIASGEIVTRTPNNHYVKPTKLAHPLLHSLHRDFLHIRHLNQISLLIRLLPLTP